MRNEKKERINQTIFKLHTFYSLTFYIVFVFVLSQKLEHQNIACDGCGRFPIKGTRFKCVSCEDYDLCECCKNQSIHPEHDFAVILKDSRDDNGTIAK